MWRREGEEEEAEDILSLHTIKGRRLDTKGEEDEEEEVEVEVGRE